MAAMMTAIVDSDVHLAETPAALAPYTDLPWRRALLEPEAIPPWSVTGYTHPSLAPRRDPPSPARTPADLLRHVDETGIDCALLLPGPLVKIGIVPTAAYAAALAGAYNRWLAEEWLPHSDRFFGAVLVGPRDPAEAAREIEQAAENARIRAVLLPMAGVEVLWGDRRYDPIYAAAEAARLPVILHGGTDLLLPGVPDRETQFANRFEQVAMSHPLVATANLVSMVGTGVFARFPALRVVFLESGTAWLVHIMMRMDKEYNENRRDIPFYTERVSRYLRQQVWVGTHPYAAGTEPGDAAEVIRVSCGNERVLFGSNWPYEDHDAPAWVAAAFADEETRQRIMGGNARQLFRLDGI